MKRYVVLVRRDNGTLDTYQQVAIDVVHAMELTIDEYNERNLLNRTISVIELVALKDTLNSL